MPSGERATQPSWPTEVGFGVVNPVTARRKAGSISIIAIGFHHSEAENLSVYGRFWESLAGFHRVESSNGI
jgi:hypothetical protein